MGLICLLLTAYFLVLLVRIAMSWFPLSPDGVAAQVFGFTVTLTEPILGPLRRALPPLRLGAVAIDLSPILVFSAIRLLQGVICT